MAKGRDDFSRATRVVWLLVGVSLATALFATLWFVGRTLFVRVPYWGEAEVVFEASRLHAHLPLYVDPTIGALEYGAPPSRFYVTYPPIWTSVVALFPPSSSTIVARVFCTTAWFGSLAALALVARRESRMAATAAATFVGGIWVVANFATIGRPDSVACALAAAALHRSVRKGRVDFVSAGLFVLVPWVKPTLVGLPMGAMIGTVLTARGRDWRPFAVAVALAASSAVFAHVASGGALFAHVIRSNAQPFTLDAWLDQVPTRLPFFAPLIAWAAWVGWLDRADRGVRIGLFALTGAVVWTLFALAKTGSSSNYWMEPCIAAVVLIARARPRMASSGWRGLLQAAVGLGSVLWADVASVHASIDHARTMRADAAFVGSARARCGASADDVVLSDEAGIELVTNGRILSPTYQMVHLARRGRYPLGGWLADLRSPHVRCFVEHTGQLRLVPALQREVESNFDVVLEEGGFRLWRRRS